MSGSLSTYLIGAAGYQIPIFSYEMLDVAFDEQFFYILLLLYFVYLICVLVCLVRLSLRLNALSHTTHLYGASLECVFMCAAKVSFRVNALSHTVHLYGVSLVCILM